jgi:hypothetical protein
MKKAQIIRIKEEIRLQYQKKEHINHQLYLTHVQAANEWGRICRIVVFDSINLLNFEITQRYGQYKYTFIDTPNCVLEDRVRYSTVHIPNVFCDGHLQITNCVELFENTQYSIPQRLLDHSVFSLHHSIDGFWKPRLDTMG